MRQFTPIKNPSKKVPGVTDTIATGLSEVLARPWLMALPLLLDLYYWIGWRFLPAALTERISQSVARSSMDDKQRVVDWLADVGKLDLSGIIGIFVPSILVGVNRDSVFEVSSRPEIAPGSVFVVCLLGFLFLIAASICYTAFIVPLADVVTGRKRPWRRLPSAILTAWARVLGLLAILAGMFVLIFGPILVITAIFQANGINFSGLVWFVSGMAVGSAAVFLWFVIAAIAAAEVGPFRAIYLSVNVVRRYFWQSVGLISASVLISFGLSELWLRLLDTAPGLLIAVIAHAFFAVGLSIASLIFFTDRLRLLRFDVTSGAFSIARRSIV